MLRVKILIPLDETTTTIMLPRTTIETTIIAEVAVKAVGMAETIEVLDVRYAIYLVTLH